MLGDQIGESQGKRIVRRALCADSGIKVEVSFEEAGKLLGTETSGFGTYWSQPRPDGTLYGEGQGLIFTKDGEMVSWKGQGVGRLMPGGAVSYRGALYMNTASQKLARVNSVATVFEFDVDASGNTHSKFWEWK